MDLVASIYEWVTTSSARAPECRVPELAELRIRSDERDAAFSRLVRGTLARAGVSGQPSSDMIRGESTLAMAIGLMHEPAIFRDLIGGVHGLQELPELVVRHAIVEKIVRRSREGAVPAALLERSPLSELLIGPRAGRERDATRLAFALLNDEAARPVLTAALARPPQSVAERRWRGKLLERIRLHMPEGKGIVLDVFEFICVHHLLPSLLALTTAIRSLRNIRAGTPEVEIEYALSVVDWVRPLIAVERINRRLFNVRYGLDDRLRGSAQDLVVMARESYF